MIEFNLSQPIEEQTSLYLLLTTEYTVVKNVIFEPLKILVIDDGASQQEIDAITQDITDYVNMKNIKMVIRSAMVFFTDTMEIFVSENVAWGITQAGQTKAVADLLQNVMRYGQTGSLYEVINEIDLLKQEALVIDGNYSPFVTVSRLDEIKADIQAYLGI